MKVLQRTADEDGEKRLAQPSKSTASELAEKCRSNCRRGRLQPLVEREVSLGFSPGLILRVVGVYEKCKLLNLNELMILDGHRRSWESNRG